MCAGEKVAAQTPVKRPMCRPRKERDEDVPEPPEELPGEIQAARPPQGRKAEEGRGGRKLWEMVRQEKAFMTENFVNPDQASQNMRQAVLPFSDQVPRWLKVCAGRQLYSAKEIRPRKRKASQPPDLMIQLTGQALMSQRVETEPVEAAEEVEVKAPAVEDQVGGKVPPQKQISQKTYT